MTKKKTKNKKKNKTKINKKPQNQTKIKTQCFLPKGETKGKKRTNK